MLGVLPDTVEIPVNGYKINLLALKKKCVIWEIFLDESIGDLI